MLCDRPRYELLDRTQSSDTSHLKNLKEETVRENETVCEREVERVRERQRKTERGRGREIEGE